MNNNNFTFGDFLIFARNVTIILYLYRGSRRRQFDVGACSLRSQCPHTFH